MKFKHGSKSSDLAPTICIEPRTVALVFALAAAQGLGCSETDSAVDPADGQIIDSSSTDSSAADSATAVQFDDAERAIIASLSPLPAPPPDPTNAVADDPIAARLGQRLYFDTRLSASGSMGCVTCHDPTLGFTDGLALPDISPDGGRRHTPTVLNAAFHRWQFWDGRVDTLWAQAAKPIENPGEQNFSRVEAALLVAADPALLEDYETVFGPLLDLSDADRFPPTGARPKFGPGDDDPRVAAWNDMDTVDRDTIAAIYANLAKSIAAYERKIVRGDSPFDQFAAELAAGEPPTALSPAAQRGLKYFIGQGRCAFCHGGPNFTNSEFHNIGLPTAPGGIPSDPGRAQGVVLVESDEFNALSEYSDSPDAAQALKLEHLALGAEQLGQFKTPSLRNLLSTGPYMHGGHFETLRDVLDYYNELPETAAIGHREETLVPLQLSDDEISDLIEFLESLEGAPLPDALQSSP